MLLCDGSFGIGGEFHRLPLCNLIGSVGLLISTDLFGLQLIIESVPLASASVGNPYFGSGTRRQTTLNFNLDFQMTD